MNYYEHHLGDYAAATAHLSWDEDMAYQRLLRAYYHHEKAIPSDIKAACRLVRADTKAQRQAVETVLHEFFERTADGWTQKRCEAEIARFRDKQQKAKRSAEARWDAQRTQCERIPNAMRPPDANALPTQSEGNAPRHQTPDTSLASSSDADGGPAPSAAPPPPPPPFDGTNAATLNGKSIVPIATGWELPEDWGLDAEKLGFKPAEVIREAERFRQYFVAGKGAGTRRSVKGWRQSWSNWLGKAAGDTRR